MPVSPNSFIYSPLPYPCHWHTWIHLKDEKNYLGITAQIFKKGKLVWVNSLLKPVNLQAKTTYKSQYWAAVALYNNWRKGKRDSTT